MVEEIITALSRYQSIFVIARNSSFSFKGRAVSEASRQLGVRYVLEGIVRKAGAACGSRHSSPTRRPARSIWADRFEDSLDDIFALQDRVALSVAGMIEPTVRSRRDRHCLAAIQRPI